MTDRVTSQPFRNNSGVPVDGGSCRIEGSTGEEEAVQKIIEAVNQHRERAGRERVVRDQLTWETQEDWIAGWVPVKAQGSDPMDTSDP